MTNEEFIKSVSLEGEIWKDVADMRDIIQYLLGRLVCHERYITAKNGHRHYLKRCLEKQSEENLSHCCIISKWHKKEILYPPSCGRSIHSLTQRISLALTI